MKKFVSIMLTLAFVAALIMALGTPVAAISTNQIVSSASGLVNRIQEMPTAVLIAGGILAAFVFVWAIMLLVAIFVLPFRIVFGFKVKNPKKTKKSSGKSKKAADDQAQEGLVLSAEDTKKVLMVGGAVVATSLLLNFALMSSRKH